MNKLTKDEALDIARDLSTLGVELDHSEGLLKIADALEKRARFLRRVAERERALSDAIWTLQNPDCEDQC